MDIWNAVSFQGKSTEREGREKRPSREWTIPNLANTLHTCLLVKDRLFAHLTVTSLHIWDLNTRSTYWFRRKRARKWQFSTDRFILRLLSLWAIKSQIANVVHDRNIAEVSHPNKRGPSHTHTHTHTPHTHTHTHKHTSSPFSHCACTHHSSHFDIMNAEQFHSSLQFSHVLSHRINVCDNNKLVFGLACFCTYILDGF